MRWGAAIVVPFTATSIEFKDTRVSVLYQNANINDSDNVAGYQLEIGSRVTRFELYASASGLYGARCVWGTVGLGYAQGKFAVPVGLWGPYVVAGLENAGGLNTPFAGLHTFGCVDGYEGQQAGPAVTPPTTPSSPPPTAPTVPTSSPTPPTTPTVPASSPTPSSPGS